MKRFGEEGVEYNWKKPQSDGVKSPLRREWQHQRKYEREKEGPKVVRQVVRRVLVGVVPKLIGRRRPTSL